MKRLLSAIFVVALTLPAAATAKSVREPGVAGWCATRTSSLALAHARHRLNERRLAAERKAELQQARLTFGESTARQMGPTVRRELNVAVIEDDGSIVRPPSPFDMTQFGVQFKRGGPWTRAEPFFGGVSTVRGDRIVIGDDDSRQIDLPFPFTFYGTTYRRIFLNSDGNLTFVRPESASTPRSLGRFLEGPPRIAAYFVDLDATSASGSDAGVYLLIEQDRIRVTWVDVPEWDTSDENTIQLTLYVNGRITVGYDGIESPEGIVGVSPGGPGTINLVDFSAELPIDHKLDAIAEEFRSDLEIDDMAAAAATLSAVRDEYDHVVVFADFPVDLGDAFAYELNVKNNIAGIGLAKFDLTSLFGSNRRLESFVQMGSLSKYPPIPDQFIGTSEATGIGILAHEVGHRWLAFPMVINNQGVRSNDLLGRGDAHWSFMLDTDGSVMEGNDIRDNGDGTFTTVGSWEGYSPLDEYLMGFRRPDEVPPFFYVSGSILDPEAAPNTGVIITGNRQNINIGQVIAAEGPRVPAAAQARRFYNVAMVLLTRQGQPATMESIQKVNRYGNRLGTFFQQETENRGRIFTILRMRDGAAAATAAPQPAPVTAQPSPVDDGPAPAVGNEASAARVPVAAPPLIAKLPKAFRERFLDVPRFRF